MNKMALLRRKAAALAAVVFLGAPAAPTLFAQNSPVGPWDIVIGGTQRGVMQLTFANDFTLTGTEIITKRPTTTHVPDDADDVRTPGGDGRNPEGGSSSTNIWWYGAADIQGVWTYDTKGRVIGSLVESGGTVSNGISFVATVRPGVRLNMTGYRAGKRIVYRGVPLAAVASFAGDY